MEMCYNGAMVMPSNYAIISNDEMEYIDGGANGWWNSTGFIAGAIDVLIAVIPALSSINALCKVGKLAKLGRVYIRENIKQAVKRCAISLTTSMLTAVVDVILVVAGASIGGVVAWAIDGLDGKRNGYCFG